MIANRTVIRQLQISESLWIPEISLGIGRCVLPSDHFSREVLSGFDQKGDLYLTTDEQVDLERQRADEAKKHVELLMAKLRSLGIDE